jgi:hypothetical protein
MAGVDYMTQCEYRIGCENNPNLKSDEITRTYCHGNYNKCARFKIRTSIGEDYLPYNLKPDELTRTREILNHSYMHHEERRDTYY